MVNEMMFKNSSGDKDNVSFELIRLDNNKFRSVNGFLGRSSVSLLHFVQVVSQSPVRFIR